MNIVEKYVKPNVKKSVRVINTVTDKGLEQTKNDLEEGRFPSVERMDTYNEASK